MSGQNIDECRGADRGRKRVMENLDEPLLSLDGRIVVVSGAGGGGIGTAGRRAHLIQRKGGEAVGTLA